MLAAELARWLQHASETNADALARSLERYGPPTQSAPHWDELDALLARKQSMAELIAELTTRYPDPVQTLRALLDELAPPELPWRDVVVEHQRALEALVALATVESLTYVLSRLEWMDWEDIEVLEDVVRTHSTTIKAAALRLWPALTWAERCGLSLFLHAYKLHDDRFFEMLMAAPVETMGPDERVDYICALGRYGDARALPHIHRLLDRALDELAASGTEAARNLVRIVMQQFFELDSEPTAAQRERAAAYGVVKLNTLDLFSS